MAEPGPRLVSINELRFRPANSNDRARAGMEHAFRDVPQCSFAGDDGISPYMGAASTISDYPDNPAQQPALHGDVPEVAQDVGAPALTLGQKLLRGGFGLSVFLHAAVALAVGYYATIPLPDEAMLEGETIVSVEFYSENDSDVTTRVKEVDQEGEDEAVEEAKEEPKVEPPKEEPKQEITKPVEEEKPVEQAKLPEPEEKPVEQPSEKIEQPIVGADVPEVLSTTTPSDFQIEAAAKQIIEDTKIEPLPDMPPALIMPIEEKKPEPEKALVQPLPHPVSKPRVVRKVAEVKPVEKPVEKKLEQPAVKKEEPKPVEKKPEPRKEKPKKVEAKKPEPKPKKKKKTVAQDGNADFASDKGSSEAKNKNGQSQDASQGNSKKKVKGNASSTNYKGLLERKLANSARRVRAGAKGLVVVAFTINASGSVTKVSVKRSSGKPAVDKAAIQAVRKASPFPAIPAELGVKTYSVVSMEVLIKG